MTVITRTVKELIQKSYRLIGLLSVDRNLSGERVQEGLYYLNELLDDFANSPNKISYNETLTFNLVVDKQDYKISTKPSADINHNAFVLLRLGTLKDEDILYPLAIEPDNFYYNPSRFLNVSNRPSELFIQNNVDESNLFFFTKPAKTFECTLKGKFVLDHVELEDVLDEVPAYFHKFLRYALARELHNNIRGSTWTQTSENTYQRSLANISSANDIDLIQQTGVGLLHKNRFRSRSQYW